VSRKFHVARVCGDCPFRRTGGIRLTRARARQIATAALGPQGATFTCHKTVDYDDDAGPSGGLHCAGALIFSERHDSPTQMMRIAERLQMYDAEQLLATPEAADIFDSLAEMLAAQRERRKA
jgi:hypothetical protein